MMMEMLINIMSIVIVMVVMMVIVMTMVMVMIILISGHMPGAANHTHQPDKSEAGKERHNVGFLSPCHHGAALSEI